MKKTLLILIIFFSTSFFHQIQAQPLPERWKLEDASPNPALEFTVIKYSLPDGIQNARIILRNLVGTTVVSEVVSADNDRLRINLQDLGSGIYIYSLVIENQVVKSKRLVISR
jgi:hypothetical protein